MKTLVVEMPEETFQEIEALSQKTQRSIGDLFRLGLSLMKMAVDETADQNRIMIATADGKPLREVILHQ
jgi:hypothetical protein